MAARRTLIDGLTVDRHHGPTHCNLGRFSGQDGDLDRAVKYYGSFVTDSGVEHPQLVDTVRVRMD
ncbi:MAG: hypothetical protein VYE68_11655 [Acidobacteriota bacterium]|nr:hypothetical protein [Acidobacteriota bacterium]